MRDRSPGQRTANTACMLAVCAGVITSVLPAIVPAEAQAMGAPNPSYYLIEYTDIGPDSTSTAAIEAGMTGAAWVELREIDRPADAYASGCTIDTCPVVQDNYYGFSPTTSDIFNSPGVLIDESGHAWTWRMAFSLSQAQYQAAEAFIANVKLPNYGLYQSNAKLAQRIPGDVRWTRPGCTVLAAGRRRTVWGSSKPCRMRLGSWPMGRCGPLWHLIGLPRTLQARRMVKSGRTVTSACPTRVCCIRSCPKPVMGRMW